MEEIWKNIIGYEGLYQISNHGRVKSLKFNMEKILKYGIHKNGYLFVTFYKNNTHKHYRVHVLVGMSFLNHKPDGTHKIVVDHIDHNKLNNHVNNLQLISNRKNCSKDRIGGTSKYVGVMWCNSKNKWLSRIQINGKTKFLGRFDDEIEASKAYQNALLELI